MYPETFLEQLIQQKNRVIYARITSLSMQEQPMEYIEGIITSGSISIDGNSAVRRTCQLSMIAQEVNVQNYLWGLNTKFKLEVGIQNLINSDFPSIIWFNQGIFIITSFSTALSTSQYTINIGGKDKMCLLNGENGGTLTSEVDFGKYEEIDTEGNVHLMKYPIKDIIKEAVHTYGGEPFHNIIINDLENRGLELQEYKYDIPLYLIRKQEEPGWYTNGTLNGGQPVWVNGLQTTIDSLDSYDPLITSDISNNLSSTPFMLDPADNKTYCATKIEYGDTVGYTETELVYNGDLIAKVGETLMSVLDKIKNMLGNFEYFYDVDGRFIFQEKKNYINSSWTPIVKDGSEEGLLYVDPTSKKIQFNFIGNKLLTAFNNTPNLTNLKNDFSVWGTRTGVGGADIPIHMRFAIKEKPMMYRSIFVRDDELKEYNKKNGFFTTGQNSITYIEKNIFDNYYDVKNQRLCLNGILGYSDNPKNKDILNINQDKVELNEKKIKITNNSITSVEKYDSLIKVAGKDLAGYLLPKYKISHIDTIYDYRENMIYIPIDVENIIICDWREIIYQMALDYRKYNHLDDFSLKISEANPEFFSNGLTGYEQFYIDLEGFWRQLYNYEDTYYSVIEPTETEKQEYYLKVQDYQRLFNKPANGTKIYKQVNGKYIRTLWEDNQSETYYKCVEKYINQKYSAFSEKLQYYKKNTNFDPITYWHNDVFNAPYKLNFWFDFLNSDGELNQFSIDNIGPRQKVSNSKDVKAIYYKDIPMVIFDIDQSNGDNSGYSHLNLPSIYSKMFNPSAQGKSAKDEIDNLLYNHSYCIESVSITSVPVYFLRPNERIYIYDPESGINGEYLPIKFTIPLSYNGTMSITATKAIDRII